MIAIRRTKAVGPRAAETYLRRAHEYAAAADQLLTDGLFSAAGLQAVHAAIAAADAALAWHAGRRSSEPEHQAVVDALRADVPDFDGAARRQLTGVLKWKNTLAYEPRDITES